MTAERPAKIKTVRAVEKNRDHSRQCGNGRIGERGEKEMRTEKEMFDLILGTAREDCRIRMVYMNGSRANKNAPKDLFQDYDIVYVVTETKPFYEDKGWIDRFGERLYMQCPDEMDRLLGQEADWDSCYGWLIQFADGNRLDLHVEPVEHCRASEDSLCRVLLDKDQIADGLPEPSDADYRVKKPSAGEFHAACNEFWWCLNNVAKGLWRREIPYVQDMLNCVVRPQLLKVLEWKVGTLTDFAVCCGKSGKYMHRWLTADWWERYLKTYAGYRTEEIWDAVFVMCGLFEEAARDVGTALGYVYDTVEGQNSLKHLEHVHELPRDAASY